MNMPLVLLNRRRRGVAAAFTPAGLFALAEPGVWYDPSDLTTLFQDTAGTTPVTTPGQTVALALDKSKGLVLGSETVVNGNFATDTWWTKGAGCSIAGGVGVATAAPNGSGLYRTGLLTSGSYYEITFTVVSVSAGGFRVGFFNATYSATRTVPGTYTVRLRADGTGFVVETVGTTTGTIDNVSVKEVTGFHATQATLASRPTYGIVPLGGRRNLLTRTEEFENAAWTKLGLNAFGSGSVANTTATTDPLGGNTADYIQESTANSAHGPYINGITLTAAPYTFSVYCKAAQRTWAYVRLAKTTGQGAYFNLSSGAIGTVESGITAAIASAGNGWYRCTVSITADATAWYPQVNTATGDNQGSFTGDGTSGIYIWGAQLETGSTATAYQRVGSAFDVTEAGVASLSYLSFDGVDDFMVTPTITPGIDKAQVFAGVRKLSDAATGFLLETGTGVGTLRTLSVNAPNGNGLANYAVSLTQQTSGAIYAAGRAAPFPAPTTNVVSGLFDWAAAGNAGKIVGRVNATAQTLDFTNSGGTLTAGNFDALPIYIGRRNGATLGFNGFLFSLLVRFGTNLDAGTITSTETWVGGKTGAYT